ncbi:MAG: hypothetical protein K6T83_09755 [Alicyclobacillus sp.]|nr:hypothetical protein [Alicyclobacillus sp.]
MRTAQMAVWIGSAIILAMAMHTAGRFLSQWSWLRPDTSPRQPYIAVSTAPAADAEDWMKEFLSGVWDFIRLGN